MAGKRCSFSLSLIVLLLFSQSLPTSSSHHDHPDRGLTGQQRLIVMERQHKQQQQQQLIMDNHFHDGENKLGVYMRRVRERGIGGGSGRSVVRRSNFTDVASAAAGVGMPLPSFHVSSFLFYFFFLGFFLL